MNRLQTKCIFASLTAHLLLLAILVVGSAFVKAPPKPENVHFVKLFDASKITDDETQGGGNPDATPPAQLIQQPAPPIVQEPPIQVQEPPKTKPKTVDPTPEPKQPTPKPQVKKPKPEPTPKVVKNPNATKIVPKNQLTEKTEPKPDKPKIDVNLTVKTAKDDPEAKRRQEERLRAEQQERERREEQRREDMRIRMQAIEQANRDHRERMDKLAGIVGNLENKMSSGTVVEMPEGPGGAAFINYTEYIWSKYYQAWQTPEDRNISTPVRVEIVVARDGRVISANIIGRSGDSVLDNSVRQALDRVRKLPAFPETSKDMQRTFKISFSLNVKNRRG
jgi:periplasmic protein TonB